MSRSLLIFVNLVAFNVCWTVTVIGVGRPWWWVGPLLVAGSAGTQLRWSPNPRGELMLVLCGAVVGATLDGLAVLCGMFRFVAGAPVFAVVFVALWVNFGTTVRPSLSWLWRRPMLAAALGAVAAPLNYWIAARLGAIEFVQPWVGTAWVALQYAAVMPVWMSGARRLIGGPAGTDLRPCPVSTPRAGGTPVP